MNMRLSESVDNLVAVNSRFWVRGPGELEDSES